MTADHIADLGGLENISSSEKNLVRRAATMSVEAEMMEQRFALAEIAGTPVSGEDLGTYAHLVGHLRRTFEALGLARRQRQVGRSFGDIMLDDLRHQRERDQAKVDATDVVDVAAGKDEQP